MKLEGPYNEGVVLTLEVSDKPKSKLNVKVLELLKTKDPYQVNDEWRFTMSCTMLVDISEARLDHKTAVLKLYDRRFADDNRARYWTQELEKEYLDFVCHGDAVEFAGTLTEDGKGEESGGWSAVETEISEQLEMLNSFNNEKATYEALQEHQGTKIPRLFETVRLSEPSPLRTRSDKLSEKQMSLLSVPGLLLEYVPGPALRDIGYSKIPRDSWKAIVEQSVDLFHMFHDSDIICQDINPTKSCLVIEDSNQKCGYRAMMIDFGDVKFRKDESDYQWGYEKYVEDEELRLVNHMVGKLREVNFELQVPLCKRFAEFDLSEDEWEEQKLRNSTASSSVYSEGSIELEHADKKKLKSARQNSEPVAAQSGSGSDGAQSNAKQKKKASATPEPCVSSASSGSKSLKRKKGIATRFTVLRTEKEKADEAKERAAKAGKVTDAHKPKHH